MTYTHLSVEEKWQRRWAEAKLGEADMDDRENFFLIFAYPGVSGYLHVGHMRGFTYSDAICRYKRMLGFNVLFPVGSHASGNVSVTFAKKVKEGDPAWLQYLRDNGCAEEDIEKLGSAEGVVDFFNHVYIEDYWKRFGFLADWRRFATTTSEGYKRFIQWQFTKLHQKGFLVQKPYYATFCPVCGPVAVDPSETDISKGGGAEKQEYTLLKFAVDMGLDKPTFLVAATLRPETVFGQTNFWANPDVEYALVSAGEEYWIISKPAAEKLGHQIDGLDISGSIHGRELLGKDCTAPGAKRDIPILPAEFCDPGVGTGLVTSVPSDAPVDWISLYELQSSKEKCREFGLEWERVKNIKPIPIIKSKGYGPTPAVEICERLGIRDSGDEEKLEEAKKEVYKIGFHTGTMMDNAGPYAGMAVEAAKESIRADLVAEGRALSMHDLSEEVLCRCGEEVVIRRIDDQWFIRYSDVELTEKSKKAASGMNIKPRDFQNNLPNILDWFQDRACVRMGSWLGTSFPLDDKWIVEPISDSTLYPIYYLVSRYVNNGDVAEENLVTEFFDYIFLGEGSLGDVSRNTGVAADKLEEIRNEVLYWYPLDINLGGKEHMTVHFPVFLMNHIALLPGDMCPKGIFVHWYITGKGGKISKSKGGAEPIPDSVKNHGVDAMRLFYCNSGSPFVDVEWDEGLVANYRSRLEKIYGLMEQINDIRGGEGSMDGWLESNLSAAVENMKKSMEDFNLRQATNTVYFEIPSNIRWYIKRGGCNSKMLEKATRCLSLLMMPFTPHISEELWEMLGGEGFASSQPLPDMAIYEAGVIEAENFIKETMGDINSIIKVTGISPKRIILYVSPPWKHEMLRMARETMESNPGPLIKRAMDSKPGLREMGKQVSQYAVQAIQEVKKNPDITVEIDEKRQLASAIPFLQEEYNCIVEVYRAGEEGVEDMGGKARYAVPGRPAIYIE